MTDKIYALVGEKGANSDITLIATWVKMPSRSTIDKLTDKLGHQYVRFAILEDILFIEGRDKPDEDDTPHAYY